jgi:hypothetical protein
MLDRIKQYERLALEIKTDVEKQKAMAIIQIDDFARKINRVSE